MKKRYGTHRTVYLIGKYAIKRPVFVEWRLFLHGLLANIQEAQFSKTGWPELCPVVFACWGGWFLVMRRAEPFDVESFLKFDYEAFVECDDYRVPAEDKMDSFGLLNGQVVAVDYGS